MTLTQLTEQIAAKVANGGGLGNTVKFNFGGDGILYLDGVNNTVSNEDKPADCTVNVTMADFGDMLSGALNPMSAFMGGKMQIDGDMSVAMILQSIFG